MTHTKNAIHLSRFLGVSGSYLSSLQLGDGSVGSTEQPEA